MDQKTDSTNTTDIAQAAITQAAANAKPDAGAAEQSVAAQPAQAENAFAAEDAELARLEAEVKAEAAKATGKAPEKDAGAATTGATTEAGTAAATAGDTTATGAAKAATVEGATEAAAAAGHNASTAAIVALRKANSELKGALLVKEGENRVLKTLVDPEKFAGEAGEGQVTTAQPTPEEQELEALAAERVRIAEEVDAGRMTMREYAEQTNAINAREREATIAQTEAMIAHAAQPVNDLGLQEHVTSLVQKYPILNSLTAAQLKPFEQIAYEQAEMEGKPIQVGPVGTKDLRERMGALATKVYGQPAQAAAGNGGTGAVAVAGSTSTTRTQPNAAEREAKLALAGNHPPEIGNTGAGDVGGGPTEAQATAALAGDEDSAIRWLQANPGFVAKTVGKGARF